MHHLPFFCGGGHALNVGLIARLQSESKFGRPRARMTRALPQAVDEPAAGKSERTSISNSAGPIPEKSCLRDSDSLGFHGSGRNRIRFRIDSRSNGPQNSKKGIVTE
jgi:hypothetical protein